MASFIQAACLTLLLGMAYSWSGPLIFERHIPIAYVHTSVEEGSASPSLLDEMNRMMATMHEHFEQMFNWPSSATDYYDDGDYDLLGNEDTLNSVEDLMINEPRMPIVDDVNAIRKKLDNMQPVCSTVTDTPTTISPRKSRRKKLRPTHTTTCTRELVHNGQKHTSEEITTIDEQGTLLKHSTNYGMVTMNIDQSKL